MSDIGEDAKRGGLLSQLTNKVTEMEKFIRDHKALKHGDSDGWVALGGTFSVRSQAYTNDPAAGLLITLNMTDTSKFAALDWVVVSSSAGSEMAIITSLVANTSITVARLTLNHTTVNPVVIAFAFTTTSDLSSVIKKGYKFKLTQSTTKYFVVQSVSSTVIKFIGNSDYLLTTGAVSSPSYSPIESPFGFPSFFNYTPSFYRSGTQFTNQPTVNSAKYFVVNGYIQGALDFTMPVAAGGTGDIRLYSPIDPAYHGYGSGLEIASTAALFVCDAYPTLSSFLFYNPGGVVIPVTAGFRYSCSFNYFF